MNQIARLGALVGLYEAIAIVRWDWLMDDPRPWRIALGFGFGLLIVLLNVGAFSILGFLCRRSIAITSILYTAFIFGARWVGQDRFEQDSFYTAGAIILFLILYRVWPWMIGLLAIALATPGLWGRVPVYTTPVDEQIAFLVPGALITLVVAALWESRLTGRSGRLMGAGLATAATLGLVGLLAQGCQLAQAQNTHPNVLFILVDTLRQDHVEPYGDGAPTPGIRRLSEEGTRFDDAITVIPKTTQSVAAFQTGKYPVTNGVRVLRDSMSLDNETLAETLEGAGYTTAAFVHNGWVMRGRGFEQGFNQFWSFFELERAYGPARLSGWVTGIDTFTAKRIRAFDGNTNAAVATDRVIDWMQNVPQPFYGYVHYFDPHWPYRPPGEDAECMVNNIKEIEKYSRGQMMFKNPLPKKENRKAVSLYKGEVTYNTDQVGRLLDTLDEMGIADNTIVVFTADHGHSLGEHNYWYHHGEFLYDASSLIPMIIRSPGELEAGAVHEDQFRSIDLFPTLLGLAGLSDRAPETDGVDYRVERPGPAFLETDISYFKWNKRRYVKGVNGKLRAVRTDEWKLVYTPRKGAGLWELFNLDADPEEKINLLKSGDAPKEITEALMHELTKWMPADERAALEKIGNRFDEIPRNVKVSEAATSEEDATSEEELSDTEIKMLQALGYVE